MHKAPSLVVAVFVLGSLSTTVHGKPAELGRPSAPVPAPSRGASEARGIQVAQAAETPAETPAEPQRSLVRPYTWRTQSSDNAVEIQQTGDDDGKRCRVECRKDGKPVWTADRCLAKLVDLRFVANDCERLVVLHQLTEPSRKWQKIQLAHVYKRGGDVDYIVEAGGMFKKEQQFRWSGNEMVWLRGALREPGDPPRYSADGKSVDFTTTDGASHSVPLFRKKK